MKKLVTLLFLIQAIAAYKTIIDVLSENEKFSTLIGHLQRQQLVPRLNKLTTGTLFAPDNDAFKKLGETEITAQRLLYHLLEKRLPTDEFYHGQLKQTMYSNDYLPDAQRIKLTMSGRRIYVNQARVTDKDLQVNNGTLIHVIDRVLEPPRLLGDSIAKINPAIDTLMKTVAIDQLLKTKSEFTVFLSTKKEPLENYNAIESKYLTSKYGSSDLTLFLKYAIIDKALYLDEFTSGKTTYKSITGDSLTITCTKKGEATINDLPITQQDILAGNGVIHQLDDIFMPESIAFSARKYLIGMDATHMNELLDHYNLSHYIDPTETNYTLLVPPNSTIPPDHVEHWLKYHVLQGLWPQDTLFDKKLILTDFDSPELGGNYQRVVVHTENDKSILFGHARALGSPVAIKNSVLYQVSEALSLPEDLLGKLVSDLDLSTFIATLYVSEVVEVIKSIAGVTLFVPTNDAFKDLGLIGKYLVHTSAKQQLQSVLKHHAVTELLYFEDLKAQAREVKTLANTTLYISQDDTDVLVGSPKESSGRSKIIKSNTLVSNGVVHKISKVQVPKTVRITNRDLLVGIECSTLVRLLEKANMLDDVNQKEVVVLAPTEKAFAQIDLQQLLGDPYQLERIVKMHILPISWQDGWSENDFQQSTEYSTLLSDIDKVTIKQTTQGEPYIRVRGSDSEANILGLGQTSFNGGVISIDAVLIPVRRGIFGLPWIWSIVLILSFAIVVSGMLSVCGFFGYKVYNRRRLGYRAVS
ncbi:FAS1 domain-containing protein [Sporodiniella umbellata]|nr:FAS1 domain-containing protein [Sporodiniella umbellata]